jgi:hypothetical protein
MTDSRNSTNPRGFPPWRVPVSTHTKGPKPCRRTLAAAPCWPAPPPFRVASAAIAGRKIEGRGFRTPSLVWSEYLKHVDALAAAAEKMKPAREKAMARRSEDSEARRLVIREWDHWVAENVPTDRKATGDDAMLFFNYLQTQRSELLDFKSNGQDRWQIIHGWLLRTGKVTD